MYNLNIPTSLHSGGGLCSTPKTPEILNSLIAMTSPLDNYTFTTTGTGTPGSVTVKNLNSANQQFISQDSSHSSCSGSPLDSPAGMNTTPSVQQTCSQLIKAGLKLSIQSKRKLSTCDSSSGSEMAPPSKCSRKFEEDSSDDDCDDAKCARGLTPEDEDRRKRRRERNKIAATKCRMKKRERTNNLIKESEQLDTQNVELKNQVRTLETQRRQLFEMLQTHSTMMCMQSGGFSLPANLCQSPALKYLHELDADQSASSVDQQSQSQPPRTTAIPPMSTIKYSRNSNGYKYPLPDLLPNGYCKPSPSSQDLGYLNSPTTAEDVVASCLSALEASTTPNSPNHHHNILASQLLKSDYIPNCENSNGGGGATVDTTTTSDFVLKHELVDSQSPYTTAQSAERFLFETNCESYDIKQHSNNNNNNTSSHNNNNNNGHIVDFHPHPATNCQSYDQMILIKNDFLTPTDSELLAHLGTDSEFTDLDTGAAFPHLTNGGCLA